MNSSAVAGFGILTLLVLSLAIAFFLIVLFVAPIKLYGIHREIKHTNFLLIQQARLLADIEERNRVQVGLLAALAKVPGESIAAVSRLG